MTADSKKRKPEKEGEMASEKNKKQAANPQRKNFFAFGNVSLKLIKLFTSQNAFCN